MAALPVVEGEVDELVDDVLDDLPVGERRLGSGVQLVERRVLHGFHARQDSRVAASSEEQAISRSCAGGGDAPPAPFVDRVRVTCAVGAIMGALALSGDVLQDVPAEELGDLMRDAIHDLLGS